MIFKPMKAPSESIAAASVVLPCLASPKMDGLRCYHIDGTVASKTGKRFANLYVNELYRSPRLAGLDGELVVGEAVGEDVIRRSMSGITSIQGKPDVTWWVFDDFTNKQATFQTRNYTAEKRVASLPTSLRKHIRFVEHELIRSIEELLAYEDQKLAEGYEGLMLRAPLGPYKCGVSTWREGWMHKFKRFIDGEVIITGIEEGSVNHNEKKADGKRRTLKENMTPSGMVGVILGKDIRTGEAVRMAPGRMTHDERRYYFKRPKEIHGRMATYRSFPTGTVNAPRFPRFITFKHPDTL